MSLLYTNTDAMFTSHIRSYATGMPGAPSNVWIVSVPFFLFALFFCISCPFLLCVGLCVGSRAEVQFHSIGTSLIVFFTSAAAAVAPAASSVLIPRNSQSVKRRYQNLVNDEDRQTQFDVFLGKHT